MRQITSNNLRELGDMLFENSVSCCVPIVSDEKLSSGNSLPATKSQTKYDAVKNYFDKTHDNPQNVFHTLYK